MEFNAVFSPLVVVEDSNPPFVFEAEDLTLPPLPPLFATLGAVENPIIISDSESDGESECSHSLLETETLASPVWESPVSSPPPTPSLEAPILISDSEAEESDGDPTLPMVVVPGSESWSPPCEDHPLAWTLQTERYRLSLNEMWSRWDGVYGGGQPVDIQERFFLFCVPYLKPEYYDLWMSERWEW